MLFCNYVLDGVDKQIFNGVPDWVYEEEILNAGYAMEFSGTGRYLVYGKFDATQVRYFKFPMYEAQSEAYTSIQVMGCFIVLH